MQQILRVLVCPSQYVYCSFPTDLERLAIPAENSAEISTFRFRWAIQHRVKILFKFFSTLENRFLLLISDLGSTINFHSE